MPCEYPNTDFKQANLWAPCLTIEKIDKINLYIQNNIKKTIGETTYGDEN